VDDVLVDFELEVEERDVDELVEEVETDVLVDCDVLEVDVLRDVEVDCEVLEVDTEVEDEVELVEIDVEVEDEVDEVEVVVIALGWAVKLKYNAPVESWAVTSLS
jgi:hypothetical protein